MLLPSRFRSGINKLHATRVLMRRNMPWKLRYQRRKAENEDAAFLRRNKKIWRRRLMK
jgi:hypothetical protein